MKRKVTWLTLSSLVGLLCVSGMAVAQQTDSYTYATYFYCDVTRQERADEIVAKLDAPIYDAAVADSSITGWGWLAHHTGGKWRRVQFHQASSIDGLLAANETIGDKIDAADKKLAEEAGKICNAHDDYIWKAVAGNATTQTRGKAAFSVYYVCDATREDQADALVKQVFGPMYDKLVAEGKLTSWGWLEHIVGGEYRRLSTMTAPDVKSLLAARSGIVAAMQENKLADAFTDICSSHSDYIWESKAGKP